MQNPQIQTADYTTPFLYDSNIYRFLYLGRGPGTNSHGYHDTSVYTLNSFSVEMNLLPFFPYIFFSVFFFSRLVALATCSIYTVRIEVWRRTFFLTFWENFFTSLNKMLACAFRAVLYLAEEAYLNLLSIFTIKMGFI